MPKQKETLPAVVPKAEISNVLDTQALMLKALEHDNVDTLKELVVLQERVSKEHARKAWHASVTAFQAACPEIPRTKKGRFGLYAPLGGTVALVRPHLSKQGLAATWVTRRYDDGAWKVCRLAHELGHVEESLCPIIVDDTSGRKSTGEETLNAMQKYGIADSYAERYSFEAVCGLVSMEADEDGDGPTGGAKRPQAPRRRATAPAAPSQDEGPPPPGENAKPPAKPKSGKKDMAERDAVDTSVTVQVEATQESTGTNSNGAWRKVAARCTDGQEYSTFSKSFAAILEAAAGEDEWLEIAWHKGRFGNDIDDVNMCEAPA